MIQGEAGDYKKIFTKHSCSTWDNYFGSNRIMDWMGGEGFGGVMTCGRDCLSGDIPAVKDVPAITEATRDADRNDIEKEVGKSY
eukprot:15336468-Ditylum_brightwellii.AAC.2